MDILSNNRDFTESRRNSKIEMDMLNKEMNNLQALRRVSIDASLSDPDLPLSFVASAAQMPSLNSNSTELYWVPASVHPELAPGEWKHYLEKKANEASHLDSPLLRARSFSGSSSLVRKRSLLSQQIKDTDIYGPDDSREKDLPPIPKDTPRRHALITVSDLQNLDVLSPGEKEESPVNNNLNQELGDEPIISAPLQTLRRSSNTHYRGRGPIRRKEPTIKHIDPISPPKKSPPIGANSIVSLETPQGLHSALPSQQQRQSRVTHDSSNDDAEMVPIHIVKSSPLPDVYYEDEKSDILEKPTPPPKIIQRPPLRRQVQSFDQDPNEHPSSNTNVSNKSRTLKGQANVKTDTEKESERLVSSLTPQRVNSMPIYLSNPYSEQKYNNGNGRKNRLKFFSSDGSDKEKINKAKKEPAVDSQKQRESTTNGKSGILSSIFGIKKKEASNSSTSDLISKPLARQQKTHSSIPPTHTVSEQYCDYSRFPIHIERAIYRLSHIKLANPRRPLLQQVLLSNFMYAYLDLIKESQMMVPQNSQYYEEEGSSGYRDYNDYSYQSGQEPSLY